MNEFIIFLFFFCPSDHLIVSTTMSIIISREDSASNHAGTIAGESSSVFLPSPCIIKILSDKQTRRNRFSLRRYCHHCYDHFGHMVGMSIQEKKEREGGNGLRHLSGGDE